MLWRELAGRAIRQQPGDRNPDESVKSVPDQVERGNLVREEFDAEKRCAGDNDGPTLQQLQSWRQGKMSEAGEQP